MRLLLDSCVWGPAVKELREAGHDVVCVADWPADPGDEEVLNRSVAETRILVTLDKDFGELVFVMGWPHQGIVRLVGIRARDQGQMILRILAIHGEELRKGAMVVATKDRLRVRLASPSDEV